MSRRVCIIVAGGSGKRMGSNIPKQFLPINDKPLLMHTISRIHDYDNSIRIILVISHDEMKRWEMLCKECSFNIPHVLVEGGKERFFSVKNALNYIYDDDIVGIHDGVRPFVSNETLDRCYSAAEQGYCTIPCIELADSIRHICDDANQSVPRAEFRAVQTPQVFPARILKNAYMTEYKTVFTDDASVVEAYGEKILLVDGNSENIKITKPIDIAIAETICRKKTTL